jgi:hypothetical protein
MYQVVMCPVEEQITGTERRLHITFAIEQHLVINGKTKIRKARRSFMVTPEQGAPTTHYLPQHYQLAAPSSTEGSDERLTAEPLNKLPEVAEKKAALSVTTGNVVQAVKQARRYDAGLPLQRSVGIRM